jgi:hypothetical protein
MNMKSGHKKGKAARWRASDTLMQMIEQELKSGTPAAPSRFSIRVLEAIAKAKRERPDHVGLRPAPVWKKTGKPTTTDDECGRGGARP